MQPGSSGSTLLFKMKKPHPQKIGRYKLLGPIGRGGMSIVYRALETESKEIVALKILFPLPTLAEILSMEELKNIFWAEARKMAGLNHPHIVKVHDLELDNRTPYFTMDYHCTNIGMMINENFILEETTRIISPKKVLDYGSQVLDGLRYIHDKGIIHRDIKPHNILVTDTDTVKICDFGTAMQEDEEIFVSPRLKVGSPYYIAPEQSLNPENADQRSDLYSVGVMLNRMLTGELPNIKNIKLSRINPIYDYRWDNFFSKALEPAPARRFQNAHEMAAALMDLELHLVRKINSTCRTFSSGMQNASRAAREEVRTLPLRAAGVKAKKAFQVNELWQPIKYTENIFTDRTQETIVDLATGLIWQKMDNGSPVSHADADSYIETLNDSRKSRISKWRLPTVNELLTLVHNPRLSENSCPNDVWQQENQWYWSCDRRSEKTSWYVNTRLGYTGWQQNNCRNHVRAVASLPKK
jgi:serine/threonine protein kinase